MKSAGRFETTTKVKIPTPFGVVLKVTIYNIDEEEPIVEYRIRPKCAICGGKAPCMCFSYDNFDDPEQEAIETLREIKEDDDTCLEEHYQSECREDEAIIKHIFKGVDLS